MFPGSPRLDGAHRRSSDGIVFGYPFVAAWIVEDRQGVRSRDLGRWVFRPKLQPVSIAPFDHLVGVVFQRRSQPKMGGIAAGRIVAGVTDNEMEVGFAIVVERPRHTMRPIPGALDTEATVTLLGLRTLPMPAVIGAALADRRPESIPFRSDGRQDWLGETYPDRHKGGVGGPGHGTGRAAFDGGRDPASVQGGAGRVDAYRSAGVTGRQALGSGGVRPRSHDARLSP